MQQKNNSKWLIFFGEDWGRHASTPQYLASELSSDFKILWVNSLGLRQPKLSMNDFKRILLKLSDYMFPAKNIEESISIDNIVVIAVLVFPFWKYKLIRRLNRVLLNYQMSIAIKKNQVITPAIITSCPSTADIIRDLESEMVVYYCADDYSQMPGMDKKLIDSLEDELIGKIDHLIVTSKKLINKHEGKIDKIHYLPHGVDYTLFRKTLDMQETDKPQDLINIKGKIIGFVGLISEHIDIDLIEKIAKKYPDANIVLIGKEEDSVDKHIKLNNVFYLGEKKRKELPAYLAFFDICLIPYKNTRRVRYANPTKFKEYIASGRPVVTYDHPEIDEHIIGVYCAKNENEYIFNVSRLLMGADEINHEKISGGMCTETWKHKSEIMLKIMGLE